MERFYYYLRISHFRLHREFCGANKRVILLGFLSVIWMWITASEKKTRKQFDKWPKALEINAYLPKTKKKNCVSSKNVLFKTSSTWRVEKKISMQHFFFHSFFLNTRMGRMITLMLNCRSLSNRVGQLAMKGAVLHSELDRIIAIALS